MESKSRGEKVAHKVEDVIVEVKEKPSKEPKEAWQAANTRKPLICKVLFLVVAAILTLTDIALISPFRYVCSKSFDLNQNSSFNSNSHQGLVSNGSGLKNERPKIEILLKCHWQSSKRARRI